MEGIRIGEEAVLKTVGLKGLGGSSPSPSAMSKRYSVVFDSRLKQWIRRW